MILIPEIKKRKKHFEYRNNFIIKNIITEKYQIIKITIITIFASLLSVLLSSQFGIFVDTLYFENKSIFLRTMFMIFLMFSILNISNIFLTRIKNILSLKSIKRIEKNIANDLVKSILNQEYYDFIQYSSGEIASRINDCVAVSMTIAHFLLTVLSDLIICIFGLVLLFLINAKLTYLLIISLILNGLIIRFTYKKIYELEHKNVITYSNYYSLLIEMINNFITVKSTKSERFYHNKIKNVLEEYKRGSFYKEKYMNNITLIQNFIISFTSLIIVFIGIFMVKNELLTLGDLAIFSTLTGVMQNVIGRIISFQYDIENFLISYNRIAQMFVTNQSSSINNDNKIKNVKLKNFSISYQGKKVLENVDVDITKKYIIINGESGTGKTSFAKVLSGLENNYSGEILVNGNNLLNDYQSSIIYLSNNSSIFEGTIRDNLCLGKIILDSYLEKVCKDFCVDKIIEKNNNNLNYKITSNQNNLSTGEKQRIALARSILLNPKLLILDEALSNIDGENKKIILKNIQKYHFKVIFITHETFELQDCQYFIFKDKKILSQ